MSKDAAVDDAVDDDDDDGVDFLVFFFDDDGVEFFVFFFDDDGDDKEDTTLDLDFRLAFGIIAKLLFSKVFKGEVRIQHILLVLLK